MLGERDAIHQPLGRRGWAESPAMKSPEQLHLTTHRLEVGDLVTVVTPAGDALGELVGRGSGFHDCGKCRSRARCGVPSWRHSTLPRHQTWNCINYETARKQH